MAALALFEALPDFGRRNGAVQQPVTPAPPAAPQIDVDSIVRAEVALAEAALAARLNDDMEAALAAERETHAAEVERLQRQAGAMAAELISARLGGMEARLAELASAGAARILGSFLSDELQRRSIDSLAATVAAAVADRDVARIEVRGPQFLFEALGAALGDEAGRLRYVEAPGFDLLVSVDGDLFETRLAEWSTALSDILS